MHCCILNGSQQGPLDSTGNSAPCHMAAWMGGSLRENGHVDLRMCG